jgi:hypothetical protein
MFEINIWYLSYHEHETNLLLSCGIVLVSDVYIFPNKVFAPPWEIARDSHNKI